MLPDSRALAGIDTKTVTDLVRRMAQSVDAAEARIFGSYVADPRDARDIDVMIVSEQFHGVPAHRRAGLLEPKPYDHRFDLFLLSTIEFRARTESPVVEAATSNDSWVIS